jgi:uncharacterized membrane protein YeaQ/YmgE (transglycosylase-associated protein family)
VVEDWLLFIISGTLGGLASALLWAKRWQDLKAFDFTRPIVLGAIGGFVYYLLHSEWNLPNSVVAFVWGYAFKDFTEALVDRVKTLFKLKQ